MIELTGQLCFTARMTVRSLIILAWLCFFTSLLPADEAPFEIDLTVATKGFDGEKCWVHARAGAIPAGIPGNRSENPLVVMTLQKLLLSGSDVFYALNEMRTSDLGETWSAPVEQKSFSRVPFSYAGKTDLEMTVCDFWPKWHKKSGTLLGTGHTVVYENNKVMKVRPRSTPWSTYDPITKTWSPWKTIEMPDSLIFENVGAGCVQRVDLENGDILLPVYCKKIGEKQYSVTVLRCSFDGTDLTYEEHGNLMTIPVQRGFVEPSLAQVSDNFFLTLRNDESGYVTVSTDGLHYQEPKKWSFDDGAELGNYNTQQHWVTHKNRLFLVYNRKGADNDHVFRHRAPLFIAEVDKEKLHVIRETEKILVPEKGARLGNFGVTEVSENETWVTVTEWMQGPAPHHHDTQRLVDQGADNRVWIAKLKWKE